MIVLLISLQFDIDRGNGTAMTRCGEFGRIDGKPTLLTAQNKGDADDLILFARRWNIIKTAWCSDESRAQLESESIGSGVGGNQNSIKKESNADPRCSANGNRGGLVEGILVGHPG